MRPALLILLCLAACAPVLVQEFGHTDDYWYVNEYHSPETPSYPNALVEQGRPVAGLYVYAAYSLARDVGELVWLRLFGLLALCALGLYLLRFGERIGLRGGSGLLFAVLTVLSPTMALCASWAIMSAFPLAVLCSALAAVHWVHGSGGTGRRLLVFTAANGLALCIYQPGACATAGFLALLAVAGTGGDRRLLTRCTTGLYLFLAILLGYYLLFNLIAAHWFPQDSAHTSRAGIRTDLLAQLAGPFAQGVWWLGQGWAGFADAWTGRIVGMLACALALWGALHPGSGLRQPGTGAAWRLNVLHLLGAGVVLAGLPLLAFETEPNYRRMMGLVPLAAGLVACGAARLPFIRHGLPARIAAAALILASAAGTAWVTHEGIARPMAVEYRRVKEHVLAEYNPPARFLVFIHPIDAGPATARIPKRGEYGWISTQLEWVPRGMIQTLYREAGIPVPEVLQVYSFQQNPLPGPWPVIDGRVALSGQPSIPKEYFGTEFFYPWIATGPADHPVFGPAYRMSDDWYEVPVLGYVYEHKPGIFLIPGYGLVCAGAAADRSALSLFHPELGWCEFDPQAFPTVRIAASGERRRLELDPRIDMPWLKASVARCVTDPD